MLVGSIPGTRADFGEVGDLGDLLDGNCQGVGLVGSEEL